MSKAQNQMESTSAKWWNKRIATMALWPLRTISILPSFFSTGLFLSRKPDVQPLALHVLIFVAVRLLTHAHRRFLWIIFKILFIHRFGKCVCRRISCHAYTWELGWHFFGRFVRTSESRSFRNIKPFFYFNSFVSVSVSFCSICSSSWCLSSFHSHF